MSEQNTTTTTAEKKLKDVDQSVLDLSAKLAAKITIDRTNGNTTVEGDTFTENLPEGLTPAIVTAINDYRSTYLAAAADSFGRKSIEVMAENPNIDTTNAVFTYGDKDIVQASVDRTYTNHLQGTTSFGHVTLKPVHKSAKNSAGALGLVRQHIGQLAMAQLKKD